MKWWIIGCISAVVVGLAAIFGLVFFVFRVTEPVVDAAGEFVKMIGNGKLKEAYHSAAPEFRSAITEAEFEEATKVLGLDKFKAVSWHRRSVENSNGEVEGTIRTTDNRRIPIKVKLSNDGEAWRVIYIGGEPAGVAVNPGLPSDEQAKAIVSATMLSFAKAIKADDFSEFYKEIAQIWQKETSPAALKQAFADFVQKRIDLMPLQGMQPTLKTPPRVDERGFLTLEGSYDTKPSLVKFKLSCTPEGGTWKLAAISVTIGPPN